MRRFLKLQNTLVLCSEMASQRQTGTIDEREIVATAIPGHFLEGIEILCGSSSSMKNAPQRARVFYSQG